MFVCKESCGVSTGNQLPVKDVITLEKDFEVPQAGLRMALPLINEAFDGQTLSVSFRQSGAIEEFKYVSSAQVAAAAKAFNDATKTGGGLATALQNEDVVKAEAKTKLLKAQAELIKAQRDLDALEKEESDDDEAEDDDTTP